MNYVCNEVNTIYINAYVKPCTKLCDNCTQCELPMERCYNTWSPYRITFHDTIIIAEFTTYIVLVTVVTIISIKQTVNSCFFCFFLSCTHNNTEECPINWIIGVLNKSVTVQATKTEVGSMGYILHFSFISNLSKHKSQVRMLDETGVLS